MFIRCELLFINYYDHLLFLLFWFGIIICIVLQYIWGRWLPTLLKYTHYNNTVCPMWCLLMSCKHNIHVNFSIFCNFLGQVVRPSLRHFVIFFFQSFLLPVHLDKRNAKKKIVYLMDNFSRNSKWMTNDTTIRNEQPSSTSQPTNSINITNKLRRVNF